MVSGNDKTFKATVKSTTDLINNLQQYSADVGMDWCFNFEEGSMVGRSVLREWKKCLKKLIGRARLTYDEFLSILAEVEMILNLRPSSYVSMEHIISKKRIARKNNLIF